MRAMVLTGRVVGAVNAALGAAMLLRPEAIGGLVSSGSAHRPASSIIRVLGGRQVLQGIALIARPGPPVVAIATATDLLHAASMLLLGWLGPDYRRPALISAAVAASSAGCEGIVLRGLRPGIDRHPNPETGA